MASREPAKIGKYDVTRVIGRGGMGIVYEARDPFLDRRVAIKMMTGGFADDPDLLKRFFREAQSTGSLQHPNIVTAFELGDHEGNPYLVMEFLEGESLDSIITSRKQLSLLEKIYFIIEVCHGLSHAHRRGIVHRDIKPANIMVSKEGVVKIVDFGIAHIGAQNVTRTGQIMGSVSYMAPEQINGSPVDARTDVFSTGVVLYELFTYSHPFDGESTAATLLKIIHGAPPPLRQFISDYPPELETIIFKALAKNREERYHSADDLALDLSQLQGRLRQEIMSKRLQEVTLLLEEDDLFKAKDQLLQALKIDRQNTEANLLLREVQQRIQTAQTKEQVQQQRVLAEEAYAEKQFETALGHVERAMALDANDVELQHLHELIQTTWSRALELQERLKQAELAHQAGDLDSAHLALEEALQLAPGEVQGTSLYHTIQRDWTERSRQRQLENYIDQARREITARNFTTALEVLEQANSVDPGDPQVKALIESATLGREQEKRRRELEAVIQQIEEALNRDDYVTARQKADEGLNRFPEERILLKLKTLAEKQRQAAERKHFVDEQLASARTLVEQGRNEELLNLLQAALAKTGPEPRLQSLLLIVRENVEHERTERRRADYLKKAKDALRQKSYDEAIGILQAALAEFKDSTEIRDLLQFAKEEAIAGKRRLLVEAAADKANALIAEQEHEQAIKLLESTLEEAPDEELRIILAEARRASLNYQRKLETTLSTAEKLLQRHKAGEALRLLEAHSSLLARSTAFQKLLERARSEAERLRKIDDFINRASQALQKEDYPTARRLLQECSQQYGSTPKLEKRLEEVGEKQSAAATKVLQKALSDAQILVMANQYEAALEKLAPTSDLIELVPSALKSEYESLRQQASDGFTRQRVAQFEQHIAAGEFTQAKMILSQTLLLFPGNRELQGLEIVLQEETNRRSEARQALVESQSLFRKADWKRGGELLKKAFTAAERVPNVREEVLANFVQAAESALEKDWRASEALLQQLAELQSKYSPPAGLQNQITQRKRQEFVKQCLEQAQQLQSGGDLQAALGEIERGLASYPDESRLVDLHAQIQEQVRQAEENARLERARVEQEAFVRGVTQRAQSGPGLERRIQILEEGVARYPQEPSFQHQLSQARELWKRVTAIVSEARLLEEAKKYDEGVRQWSLLRNVYPQYPELDSNLGRVTQLAEQARADAKAGWIRSVQAALASADYDRAADLLGQGRSKFPGDRELSEFEKKLQDGLKLRAKAQKIVADGRAALGKKKWEKAAGYLTRACEIAAGDPAIQEQVLNELLEGCEAALEVDSTSAEMLLARAAQIQPNAALLSPLRARIENQKREQMIEQHLTAAVRAQAGGDWQDALRQIEKGLFVYPNEPRLSQVKHDIETRLRQLEEEQQGRREAEKERARQAELERQRQIELKRKQEFEQERAKAVDQQRQQELERKRQREAEQERAEAAENEREVVRARELELQRQQERAREKELDRQREAGRKRQEEEQRAHEEAEKKRQLAAQKLAQQARRREEALRQSEAGKTIVGLPAQILKNTRLLVISGGALLLVVVLSTVWIFMPRAVPVEITTTPVGTTVRIKATGEECVTPRCMIKLRPGKYEIEFSHQGYETKTQSISVQARGPNPISIALPALAVAVKSPPPPPTIATPSSKPASMRIHGWKRGAHVYLDGKLLGTVGSRGTFSASVSAAEHDVKVVDKNGQSGIIHRPFAAGESADLAKGDFALGSPPIPPPPAPSPEEHDWQQVAHSGSIAELEQFRARYPNSQHLGELEAQRDSLYWDKAMAAGTGAAFSEYLDKFPNGAHRGEAQENVAWSRAEASNTIPALRNYQRQYPQGRHFDLAGRKIEEQRFQQARNSGDEAVLEAYLKDYPQGPHHDQIFGRLDDLEWEKTNKNNEASLQAYIAKTPPGRHLGQAQDTIEKLIEAAKPVRPSLFDSRTEVLKVIQRYIKAYDNESVQELRQIWPGMDKKQISGMRDFFRMARNVKSTYTLLGDPQINGGEAAVRIRQVTTFVVEGQQQESSGTRTLKLKPNPGAPGSWEISSVSED
jgi:eukaryotic-like serine/threonine-protein kinase